MKGLIITYALAVIGTVGSLRYPLIGLFTYVFFAILRPQFIFSFAGDMSGLSFWLGTAMLVGWAFHRFGSWKLGQARGIVRALLLFLVWFTVSACLALDPGKALGQLPIMARFVLPVLMGVTLLDDPKLRRLMMWTIVAAQGYVGFEMNLMYLKGFNIAADGFGGMDNNCFGVSLVAALGPAVALAIGSKTWRERAAASACAALILHTTLLTFSRGALIGMLAVGAVAFVIMPKRPKYVVAMLLVSLVALRFTGKELAARYMTAFVSAEERDGSAESRVDLWADCLKVVAQYPVLGVGPGNWRVIASSYGWSEGKSAHSVWMEMAAETGVVGSVLLFGFFFLAAAKLWPIARARSGLNDDEGILAFGAVLSIVGFVVAGQFVSVPGLELPYYVVMVGAAIVKNPKPTLTAEQAPDQSRIGLHPAMAQLVAGRARVGGR